MKMSVAIYSKNHGIKLAKEAAQRIMSFDNAA